MEGLVGEEGIEVSSLEDWLHEAESGDLRPQVNPQAIVRNVRAVDEQMRSPVVRVLLQRFLALARPIGDASRGPRPDLRLQDAGPFFYLVETLARLDCSEMEATLLILLDDFAQMEPRSYDELYLWSLVQLCRTDPRHVDTFWPMVVALDVRYRSSEWKRPAGVPLNEQPYRLTELLLYYYLVYTRQRGQERRRLSESLAECVRRTARRLSPVHYDFLVQTLRELYRVQKHPDLSDACGLLLKPRA